MKQNNSNDEIKQLIDHFDAREKQYHHTLFSEKRHELLFAPYHVNFTEYRILAYLLGHPEDSEPSKIADTLLILRQTMTNNIDSLQKRELVQRIPHSKDRRKVCVQLLPAGRELAITLLKVAQNYSVRIRSCMSAEEFETYYALRHRFEAAQEEELNKILAERDQQRI